MAGFFFAFIIIHVNLGTDRPNRCKYGQGTELEASHSVFSVRKRKNETSRRGSVKNEILDFIGWQLLN